MWDGKKNYTQQQILSFILANYVFLINFLKIIFLLAIFNTNLYINILKIILCYYLSKYFL